MKAKPPLKPLAQILSISPLQILPHETPERRSNYVGLEHIEGRTGKLLSRGPTPGAEIRSTKNVFAPGQILYGKLRPNLNKVYLAAEEGVCSTDILVLRRRTSEVVPAFVCYFLRSPLVLNHVVRRMRGANLPRLSPSDLLRIPIPVPSMEEQRRIVRLLDAAEDLRRLRQQADRRTAELVPAIFHEMFGDPATNSRAWPVFPFGLLATNEDGRRRPVKASDRSERQGQYPYYGASGVIDSIDEFLFDGMSLLVAEDGAKTRP